MSYTVTTMGKTFHPRGMSYGILGVMGGLSFTHVKNQLEQSKHRGHDCYVKGSDGRRVPRSFFDCNLEPVA